MSEKFLSVRYLKNFLMNFNQTWPAQITVNAFEYNNSDVKDQSSRLYKAKDRFRGLTKASFSSFFLIE